MSQTYSTKTITDLGQAIEQMVSLFSGKKMEPADQAVASMLFESCAKDFISDLKKEIKQEVLEELKQKQLEESNKKKIEI